MSINKPNGESLTLDEAKNYLSQQLGSSPDKEILLEWLRLGYLVGEEQDSQVNISTNSLNLLAEQLQQNMQEKREARLTLHAVDIWRRDSHQKAIAVTLSSPNTVVTKEVLCEENDMAMLEATVKATLAAVGEILGNPMELELVQVKHYALPKLEQSMVAVLVKASKEADIRTLSGVAMADNTALPLQVSARATLNALNRTIAPYLRTTASWREVFKKFLLINN